MKYLLLESIFNGENMTKNINKLRNTVTTTIQENARYADFKSFFSPKENSLLHLLGFDSDRVNEEKMRDCISRISQLLSSNNHTELKVRELHKLISMINKSY
jgi:Mg2+ and Co2+ transporter CorA